MFLGEEEEVLNGFMDSVYIHIHIYSCKYMYGLRVRTPIKVISDSLNSVI